MRITLQNKILEVTNSQSIDKVEQIQELWSGYGSLLRVTTEKASFVVKLIELPDHDHHPRGWNSKIGHERKKRSYEVENYWYKNYQSSVESYFPKLIQAGIIEGSQFLILEDLGNLKGKSFTPKKKISALEVKTCLSWLANFHKQFLNQRPVGLWEVGTYWHLATRPEELKKMSDQELKLAAPKIDSILNEAKHQTIVHGDAKLANFLFFKEEVAIVDFQYVGGGVGVKDLAYFLGSVFDENELLKNEKVLLDYYFEKLNLPEVEEEWRTLFPYAWCDFYRFLQGWSPGHWKINEYSIQKRDEVLAAL